MRTYVDESGTFVPARGISLVSALVVPDRGIAGLEKLYGRLRQSLPKDRGEVKGRLLDENQVAAVADIARKVGCLLETSAVDMLECSADDIDAHRSGQIAAMSRHLTDQHFDSLKADVRALQDQLAGMSRQLYVQAVVQGDVIHRVLQHTCAYFGMRDGSELGSYGWIIDGKDPNGTTAWERWWYTVLTPMLQWKSLREPMLGVEGGDYRAQERFRTELPDWMREFTTPSERSSYLDLGAILKTDFRFSSKAEVGLEVADIMANATRRALTGSLGERGYLPIRRMMIHRGRHYISMLALHQREVTASKSYMPVLRAFSTGGRSLLTAGD